MNRAKIRIGPGDHGKQMSLADFDHAVGREGYRYELGKGVIAVTDVPHLRHLSQLNAVRQQLYGYKASHPHEIETIASASECKFLIYGDESERHPDLAIYKNPPMDEADLWANWIPEIAVEVVSNRSRQCDYIEKRDEYLLFGIGEYWIIDAELQQMLAMRRPAGRWVEKIVPADGTYRTRVLPEFELKLTAIFEAARAAS